jgi:transcriptional regulator with XRE-family HTH domain
MKAINSLIVSRKSRGISQFELARKSGVEQATISRLENYQIGLSEETAAKLAPHLRVKADELVSGQLFESVQARLVELAGQDIAEALGTSDGARKIVALTSDLLKLTEDSNLPEDVRTASKARASRMVRAIEAWQEPDATSGDKQFAARGRRRDAHGRSYPDDRKEDTSGSLITSNGRRFRRDASGRSVEVK